MYYLQDGIKINSLSKTFADVKALDSITLKINRGKIVGLVGKNGAGKSTLVRLLSGVMKPTSGTATILGFDIHSNIDDVKRITGLLPEEYALYEKLSIFEYVEFIAKLYDLSDNIIEDRFNELSKKLDIMNLRNRMIETLSKGQKQKVAIITSLIHEPDVVFFDEPISNLDVQSQRVVKQIIKEYRNSSKIIIIATHLLSNIETSCDDIIIIDAGKILFNGSIDEFKKSHDTLENAYLDYLEEI